ncbi:tRNA (N6-isopentenyl adenosine(37)-C2)-methylthiotransferase MiaB [Agrobacterium vitis]|uniref:tRNA-2-methylthio-N(6)-dimethylallyladenosine synthase n=1 Tax=Agrobacterium vitis TaxID=373 RepID=A0ABD6G6N1_AGRVI|nr:tRNA (N6-isopentenyl adenosine(37)-C2)-methylthiotransferase MiaB [Agrobacterium vitis]MUO79904.1 tRNA (N6-isopentenyl adenosine(37)-C2)-methylthiotransferase MiaB [Agrobacterium vitis]MUO93607.1 tRNA (N6-isopentenyl adenosine(37)-C2)-methylthiotransferase MiaB [Agrobacterium vitis]MUP04142.1 tRNA (N6-isopentenyl adenosine(37)-C2)-methylthiotransferase MiaB [Agrobacterium vitis]MUZ83096.1 tRNA (N6-isopentenyl adenosine(37)-C2)-methylthiotransferase MiaB [Agrobacterium vitis]MVA11065.1 tRNA 
MTQEISSLSASVEPVSAMVEHTSAQQNPAPQKKVFIKTYGCQMNVYDSSRMADALVAEGYQSTEDMEEASLVLLNTCHIREKAADKVYSALGRLREMKKIRAARGEEFMIGVAGCVAQAEGEEIVRREPGVDVVVGPQTYHRLPQALRRARSGERVVDTDYAVEDKFEHLPDPTKIAGKRRMITAFLTVQEGCDKFCTFCVVPYTRGSEVSRPLAQLLGEAQRLVESGVREITLLGQNVNAWHGKGPDGREMGLGDLLYKLAEIPGLARLRYTTSHPRDMDERLIEAHRDLRMLMPYLHLPVQSGSDRILKAMNRRHKAADYIALVDRIREARPDIAISGDFIVGFPGETDADFEDTLKLVERIGYAQAFSFKYSPRPGTPGADMPDHVAEDVKTERLARLQELLLKQQHDFARSLVGQTMDLLLEKPGRMPGQIIGRSPWLQSVNVDAKPSQIGDIIQVRITDIGPNSLFAEVAES